MHYSNHTIPAKPAGATLKEVGGIGIHVMKNVRILLALLTLVLVAGSTYAAGSIRFFRTDPGLRSDTVNDDELIATRLRWNEPTAPQWTVFRDKFSRDEVSGEQGVIVPNAMMDASDPRFTFNQARVMDVINKSIDEWNSVGAAFEWSGGVIPSDFWSGFNSQLPTGPIAAGLDRFNMITFQDPFTILDAPTDGGFVIAVTSIFYFNQDVDLSDLSNLPPPTTINFELADGIAFFNTFGDLVFALPRQKYKAGNIIDTDIIFNQNITFYQIPPDDELSGLDAEHFIGGIDIESVTTHEMGHAAGLSHAQLSLPTMTPVQSFDTNPWHMRGLDFDDKLSLKMAYKPLYNRLGKGAITGLVINGDAVDGITEDTPEATDFFPDILENTPVFVGRPSNEPYLLPPDGEIVDPVTLEFLGDHVFGRDETTSQINKIRLFASVLNSPETREPLGFSSPVVFDNRYFIPGLPSSSEPIKVGDGVTLEPNKYAVYIRPGRPGARIDEVTAATQPADDLVPSEFYGGATSYFQPGLDTGTDPNTPSDFLVQDSWLQFGFTRLGQFSLALAQSTFQLVDDFLNFPTESFITYHIVKGDQTIDVANNVDSADLLTSGMVENDLANRAVGNFLVANTVASTQTIELGRFRANGITTSSASDMRITVQVQNITDQSIQTGLRFLVRPVLNGDRVHFFISGQEFDKETTINGVDIPPYFEYGPNEFFDIKGLVTLSNPAGLITTPDQLQFVDFTRISSDGNKWNYQIAGLDLNNAAYTVTFNPRTLLPGQVITFSTDIGYSKIRTGPLHDGPIYGPDPYTPGADDPQAYYPVDVTTNTVTTGIDILTNTGEPGGLTAGGTDTSGGGGSPTGDDDNDGVINAQDNCVKVANPDQSDVDNDGIGDACDADFQTFTDVSPNATGSDRKDGVPLLNNYALGATFGDVNNDGFPDLAIANSNSLNSGNSVNRLYINVPDPTANEPGGRRFIDATFGVDGIPGTLDDRMPFVQVASSHITLADFDNDGDLDMYVCNFDAPGNTTVGYQNFFYENVDVDDPSLNPSPDADSFGDGFFVDATSRWDPGILNVGPFNPYINALDLDSYGFTIPGFDYTTYSEAADIDGDGDIDVIVGNANCFNDIDASPGIITTSPPQSALGGLRFSERVLINHTREPANSIYNPPPPGFPYRFRDETLGEDQVFGGFSQDRMPPLKPEWSGVSDTNSFDEVDFSNTRAIRLSAPYIGEGNGVAIHVFDKRNAGSFAGSVQQTLGSWDGDDIVYANADLNGDGMPDGVYYCVNYGFESWLRAPDGTVMFIGCPDGLPADRTTPPESDQIVGGNDQSVAGLMLDADYSGYPELISINTAADHRVNTNFNGATQGFPEVDRSQVYTFGVGGVFEATDYVNVPGGPSLNLSNPPRRESYTLPRFGRARDAATEDFNLDGTPDIVIANDSDQTENADVAATGLPPGHLEFHINRDWEQAEGGHTGWLSMYTGVTSGSQITNESARFNLSIAAADIDLDGDIDLFAGTADGPGVLYRNNLRKAGVGATVPGGAATASSNNFDLPLFVDQTFDFLPPYFGGAFDPFFGNKPESNISLGVALADMDHDGDLDLVFANGGLFSTTGDYQIVYKNNGKPLIKTEKVFTPAGTPYAAPYLQSNPANMPWLENFPYAAYDVKFVDVNDDGSADIFFTVNGGAPRLYINRDLDDPARNSAVDADSIPDGIFVQDGRIGAISDTRRTLSRRCAVGDINGDGHVDFVIANADNVNGAPNIILINTIGAQGWGYFVEQTDTRLPQMQYKDTSGNPAGQGPVLDDTVDVALSDLDNDGDLDIVFVNRKSTAGEPSPNFYPYCRLLINDGTGVFTDITDASYGALFNRALVQPERWPMIGRAAHWEGVLVGDFANRGESGEDINGNSTQPYKVIEETEDLNHNGIMDYSDTGTGGTGGEGAGNGRRDVNFDLLITNGDTGTSNVLLMNGGGAGAFGNATFTDETQARMPNRVGYPCYGGDVGDVNNDGLLDIVLALDTHTSTTQAFNGLPSAKIPLALLINTAPENPSNAGNFVDVTGYDGQTANGTFRSGGELPVLKVQFPPTGINLSEAAKIPGNCHAVRFADVDGDGDLDIVIAQTGRGDLNVTPVGWFNNVLINMSNPANFNSHDVFSVRDPGGPILKSATPAIAAQGQLRTITLNGRHFSGQPNVDFGAGITVVERGTVPNNSDSVNVVIKVDANAPTGPRIIKLTNPDGQFTYSTNHAFTVVPASQLAPTAVQDDWQLYQ